MSEVPVEYAPPPPPPPPRPPVAGFDFVRPFAFVFDDPRWLPKILIGGLFYLAGFLLIGMFFVLGYAARLARNVMRGSDTPLPEWDDLGDYFSEGARLIGIGLVYTLPVIALVLTFILPVAITAASGGNEVAEAVTSGIAGCVACLIVPLVFLMILFMPASLIFAVAEERFGAAFEFGRIWPFIRENVGNYLLAIVIYLIAGFVGEVGVILLCIGVIFTGFWSVLIIFHAFAQVYKLAPPRA